MNYTIVTRTGHVLGTIDNLEDARDFADMMERKLRSQGFVSGERYPRNKNLVRVIYNARRSA